MVADGTCIIEVFPKIQGGSDLMKPLNLKQSVRHLLRKCVAAQNPEGGIVVNLGKLSRDIEAEPLYTEVSRYSYSGLNQT